MTFLCRWKWGPGRIEWPLMFHSGPRTPLSLVKWLIKGHPHHLTADQSALAPLCRLAYCLPPPCRLPYKTSGDTRPWLFQLSLPAVLVNSLWSNARQKWRDSPGADQTRPDPGPAFMYRRWRSAPAGPEAWSLVFTPASDKSAYK